MVEQTKSLGGAVVACGLGALAGSEIPILGWAGGCGLLTYAYLSTDCAPIPETSSQDNYRPSTGRDPNPTKDPVTQLQNDWYRFVVTVTAETVSGSYAVMIYSIEVPSWQGSCGFESVAKIDPTCFPEEAEGDLPAFDTLLAQSLVRGAYNAQTGDFSASFYQTNEFDDVSGCSLILADNGDGSCELNDSAIVYEGDEPCELEVRLDANGAGSGTLRVGEEQMAARVQGEKLRDNE